MKKQLFSGDGLNNLEEKDPRVILEKVDKLKPIATSIGCTLAQLSLAWCLKNPNVSTVITGASNPQQIIENFKSLEIVQQLTPDIMEEIELAMQNKPSLPWNFK